MALLEVVSPSTAAWADARLAGNDALRSPSGHVEGHPTAACPCVHASECVLCQYLTTPGRLAPRVSSVAIAQLDAPRITVGATYIVYPESAPRFPRAPPVA